CCLSTASSTATARRESARTQGTFTRIRPAASDTTCRSVMSNRSVIVVVIVVADGGRLGLFTDALAGLGHHVGQLQAGGFRRFLGTASATQTPLGCGDRCLVERGLGECLTQEFVSADADHAG